MQEYLRALQHIRTHGTPKTDRTGTGTLSYFGMDMRFDISNSFPLVTTKRCHFKSIAYELLWFLQGNTNVRYLQENGVKIWDEWADTDGNLGPVYGKQWRSWATQSGETVDQIQQVIDTIKTNPDSRRLIVSAWNVGELDQMALPPCHLLFQFYVVNGTLSCKLTQRSADFFLGVPFNIASYSLLTYMIAAQCNLKPGTFVWSGGDCHIYNNHIEQVDTQLSRAPMARPTLRLARLPQSINNYRYEDFILEDYQSHGRITAPVAV